LSDSGDAQTSLDSSMDPARPSGINMTVCLAILTLAPVVTVIGYEIRGYRHQAQALAD
jgi:hypothetical protein